MSNTIERKSPRNKTQMIPQAIDGKDGMVAVDTTWGKIQPVQAASGVQTVGEPRVIQHLEKGLPVVDVRAPETKGGITIPGARSIPHGDMIQRMNELDRETASIFFCNGPQCPQSPSTIRDLLEAGFPAEKMLYYRGGMHNWITLGLPVEKI